VSLRLPLLASLLLCLIPTTPGCSGAPSEQPPCADGIDNDGDGYLDEADPSCAVGHDTEDDDPITDCSDGEDDDGDGLVDLADPGCSGPVDDSEVGSGPPARRDGHDNDGDGKSDYPNDPGCSNPLQNDEADGCPDGACPQCGDGVDNDEDGLVDYPQDPGCKAASDNTEIQADPGACAGVPFTVLPSDGHASGPFQAGNGMFNTTCGGATPLGAGKELVYQLYLEEPHVVVASTDVSGTTANTVLYVRSECDDAATELACNDDAHTGAVGSKVTVALDPGYYYVIVDNKNTATTGNVELKVDLFPGAGLACDPGAAQPCGPGLVCRTLAGASGPTCEEPVCSDGRDDDSDGTADFPGDPGCTSAVDTTEDDDCPSGPGCPDCADGIDNDGDGQIDFPQDASCHAASQAVETCGSEQDAFGVIDGSGNASGSTTGYHDDFDSATCFGTPGPDVAHLVTFPVALQSLNVDTLGSGFDTSVIVTNAECGTPDLGCEQSFGGGASLTIGNLAAGTYAVYVDSWGSTESGAYQLHVRGVVAPGAACTDGMFATGVLTCPADSPCDGAICHPPQCNNGIDDDGDGHVDFPSEPGCANASDNDETDACPGPACAACSNGLDDDGDGLADYPADPNCVSAVHTSESCETDPTLPITTQTTTGTTTGANGDFTLTCGVSGTSPDRTHLLTLPVPVTTLAVDTISTGFDTVLEIKTPACDATALACNDDGGGALTSSITMNNVAAGNYIIVVDGYSGASGNYTLHVHGTVAAGAACSSPLFAAGVLACSAGQTCNGTVCQ